jgi:homocysteine S-methyltransferase
VTIPPAVLERMRRASERGKEAALAEGVAVAREMLAAVRDRVQGAQVSAPLGRVPVALEVLGEVLEEAGGRTDGRAEELAVEG